MTAKQIADSPFIRFSIYALMIGIAWGATQKDISTMQITVAANTGKIEMLRESLSRMEAKLNVLVTESHQQHEMYCRTRREQLGCQP